MDFLDWEFNQHTPEKVQAVSSARGPISQKVKAVSRHFNRVTGNLVETSRRELLITPKNLKVSHSGAHTGIYSSVSQSLTMLLTRSVHISVFYQFRTCINIFPGPWVKISEI